MALKMVLQIVDGQDVLLMATRPLEPKLKRRYSKDEMEMALLAAEEQLADSIKAASKRGAIGTD